MGCSGREVGVVQVIGPDAVFDEGAHELCQHVGIVVHAPEKDSLAEKRDPCLRQPGDRGPLWLPDGGLAFTRRDAAGRPAVMRVAAPGAPPTRLLDGWVAQDRTGDRLLVLRDETDLAWYQLATGELTPIPRADRGARTLVAARVMADGGVAMLYSEQAEVARLDPARGTVTPMARLPAGQTAQSLWVLPDGRVAYRAELWLGELYQLDGAW